MPIRLDFCDFWPGYPKTNNLFYNLLSRHFDLQISDHPEFVIYSDGPSQVHRLMNCVRIYFSVEAFRPDWSECDYGLTCHYLEDPRHLRLPFYVLDAAPEQLVKGDEDWAGHLAAKTRFCTFVVSNGGRRKTQRRVDFFHRLSRYKKVDSGGRYLNNIGGPLPPDYAAKIAFLRQGKFNIAFENASVPGYTTEKIVHAMKARCLPIYWGSPRVAEEFNPRSFLNAPDFPTEEALIEKIIELDRDDAKYLEWLRQPCFHDNRINPYFHPQRLIEFFGRVFSTPIRPVASRRRFFHLGRWRWVKQNKPHGPAWPEGEPKPSPCGGRPSFTPP